MNDIEGVYIVATELTAAAPQSTLYLRYLDQPLLSAPLSVLFYSYLLVTEAVSATNELSSKVKKEKDGAPSLPLPELVSRPRRPWYTLEIANSTHRIDHHVDSLLGPPLGAPRRACRVGTRGSDR